MLHRLLFLCFCAGCVDVGQGPQAPTPPTLPIETTLTFRYALTQAPANSLYAGCQAADVGFVRVLVLRTPTDPNGFITDINCSGGDADLNGMLTPNEYGSASLTLPDAGDWLVMISMYTPRNYPQMVRQHPLEATPTIWRSFDKIHTEPGANFVWISEGLMPGAAVFSILPPTP